MQRKERQSNFELLRIVAMLLVLLHHSTFFSNGALDYADVIEDPIGSFFYSCIEAFALICVNCYVLVSGYFGIKAKWRGFLSLLFIVYFWRFALLGLGCLYLDEPCSIKDCVLLLNPFMGEWFVGAYIALYILSPILNGFANNSSKEDLKKGLSLYIVVLFVLGWLIPASMSPSMNFENGYSVFSFVGLYLVGRYLNLHCDATRISQKRLCSIYACTSVTNALIYTVLVMIMVTPLLADINRCMFISYDSPFTFIGSVAVLLIFSKIKIQSKIINWIAASSFSVYLIHCNSAVLPYYINTSRILFQDFFPWLWLPVILAFIVGVYTACTLLDQVRAIIWHVIDRLVFVRKQ